MVRHDVVDMGHNQANTATGLGEPVMQHPFRGTSVSRHEQSGMAGDDDSVSHGHRADGERGKQMLKLRCRHVFVTSVPEIARWNSLPTWTLQSGVAPTIRPPAGAVNRTTRNGAILTKKPERYGCIMTPSHSKWGDRLRETQTHLNAFCKFVTGSTRRVPQHKASQRRKYAGLGQRDQGRPPSSSSVKYPAIASRRRLTKRC